MNKEEIEELKQKVIAQEKIKDIHTPYESALGHEADFEIEYELDIAPELKGIKPLQGMRCDFLYDGDNPSIDGIHMIWPELLDLDGNIILDNNVVPEVCGCATMWIGYQEARENIHQKRIKVGTQGYWVVGSKRLAKVKVTKILGLFTNTE